MSRYPQDPNTLFREIVEANQTAKTLRDEGWTVQFGVAENDCRIWVKVAATRSGDPPASEGS